MTGPLASPPHFTPSHALSPHSSKCATAKRPIGHKLYHKRRNMLCTMHYPVCQAHGPARTRILELPVFRVPHICHHHVQKTPDPSCGNTTRTCNARRTITNSHALSYIAPVCLDQACQASSDRTFLLTTGLPLLVVILWALFLLRPGQLKGDTGQPIWEEGDGPSEAEGESDTAELRVVSYTPFPVDASYVGERMKLKVGLVSDLKPRTYVFPLVLPGELLAVTLPRPLGVVLEWDEQRRCAVVCGLAEGSNAEQRAKVASLNKRLAANAVLPGDVLRAVTTTCFVYTQRALWGAVPPERHIVVYSADKQKFTNTRTAMRKGESRDGPVTLVIERLKSAEYGR